LLYERIPNGLISAWTAGDLELRPLLAGKASGYHFNYGSKKCSGVSLDAAIPTTDGKPPHLPAYTVGMTAKACGAFLAAAPRTGYLRFNNRTK
jgi:hypothetical protein